MNSITRMFHTLETRNEKGLFPFIVGGYPDMKTTEALLVGLQDAGADLIEIGVPFSDPVADGPVIQRASYHAVEHGVTLSALFDMVARVHTRSNVTVPIVFMTYYNPLLQYGIPRAMEHAAHSGVDGFIVPDCSLEATNTIIPAAAQFHRDIILLAGINCPTERLKRIAQRSTGFLYLVSHLGVTGVSHFSLDPVREKIKIIRSCSSIPVAVGFGISNAEQASTVASLGDAIIIGSALITHLDRSGTKGAVRFISSIKKTLNQKQI